MPNRPLFGTSFTFRSWKIALPVAAALLLSGLVLYVLARDQEHRSIRAQTWKIGYGITEPFLFKDPDGLPAGFGKDVLTEAARRAVIRLEWVLIPQGASAAFQSGAIDLFPRCNYSGRPRQNAPTGSHGPRHVI